MTQEITISVEKQTPFLPGTVMNNEFKGQGDHRTGSSNYPDNRNQQVFITACRQLYGTSSDPYDITIMKTFLYATQGMSLGVRSTSHKQTAGSKSAFLIMRQRPLHGVFGGVSCLG